MALTVDDEHLGTSEAVWNEYRRHENLAPLTLRSGRRLVVIAPHPDDEVLGAGGLIQTALKQGMLVEIIAVTGGEASHPRSKVAATMDLVGIRSIETREALRRLGCREPHITWLELPDGKVSQHRSELEAALSSFLLPDDVCAAPWRRDGHPDHEVCGESALVASATVGTSMLEYLVWAWHWAHPESHDIPWEQCRRLDLTRRERARKRFATSAFESQTQPLGPDRDDAAILPTALMRRFWRSYEVYVETREEPQ